MNQDPSSYIPEAVGHAAETADRLSRTAQHRAQLELKRLRLELARVANTTGQLAKENPWAAAGTLIGVGMVLGAIGYGLFAPRPTLRRTLETTLLPKSARVQLKRQLKALRNYF